METHRGVTLLIVDDNEAVLHTKQLLCENHGYVVKTAMNAYSALELFKHTHVDLVLSDYYLPDFTGDELCRIMKQLKPTIPMVITSGTIPDYISDCADFFTIKGTDPALILHKIDELLRKSA